MKRFLFRPMFRLGLVAAVLFVLLAGPASASAAAQGALSYAALPGRDVANASLTHPAETVSANFVYIVQRGDTLAKIAARYHTTVAAILALNPSVSNPNRIYIGQRLVIPSGSNPPPAKFTTVSIYLVGIGSGNVGCGDQLVPVKRTVPATTAPLTAALNDLLAQHSQYYGQSGLYNALYQSNLAVQKITRSGTTWNIYLRGSTRLNGECDNPRVEAQLLRTALQFSTVKRANFYLNGVPLHQALSLK